MGSLFFLVYTTMDNTATKQGKVYLIGAGPGDPKLLTIKAAEILKCSDVIVYDYLVHPEILIHADRTAELIYVGKQAGISSITQTEINRILIAKAGQGKTVARLKGGDPFIFGRGGEEAEALVAAGIVWEVIPGITSAIGVAAYAGIPLTHRHYASSVAFITGHNGDKSRADVDWSKLAQAADTLVIYMCAHTITEIARKLIAHQRAAYTPVAIIRWGTYAYQEIYTGTLAELAAMAGELSRELKERFSSPAIAIVGEVVNLQNRLHWFGNTVTPFANNYLMDMVYTH